MPLAFVPGVTCGRSGSFPKTVGVAGVPDDEW